MPTITGSHSQTDHSSAVCRLGVESQFGVVLAPDYSQDVLENFYGWLKRINKRHHARIKIQNRLGLFFVGGEPLPNHIFIGIVEAVVFNRSVAQTTNQFFAFWTREMK